MPSDILLYALIAAGLVFWLRNVLGTRHGDERERPNPFTSAPADEAADKRAGAIDDGSPVSVSSLDGGNRGLPRNTDIENVKTEVALEEIARADKNFDLHHFISGSKDAFVMIVEAFAEADRETLRGLLGESVYQIFDAALQAREAEGQTVQTEVHAIRQVDIMDARIQDKMIFITLRFTAQETCVIRDRIGDVVSGNPDRITEMSDIWVFGRKLKSRDSAWLLYETRDGDPEDHKTPLPDAV